jgi:flagellar basal body-associated protein FliL
VDEKEIERIADLADDNLDLALAELNEAILQEDPDFAKTLKDISIDDSAVLSALDAGRPPAKSNSNVFSLKDFFQNLIEFKKNPKKVMGFWIGITFLFAMTTFVVLSNIWTSQTKLFINSFADLGADVYTFDPQTETESFFENPKLARNLVSLSRMVANILPTNESSKNPMLAVELTIEGMNTEVVVEIKDSEAEFKDLILRLIEQENYDFLNTEKGKISLAMKIRDEMNTNLTRGQVRKALYKSFVIKR